MSRRTSHIWSKQPDDETCQHCTLVYSGYMKPSWLTGFMHHVCLQHIAEKWKNSTSTFEILYVLMLCGMLVSHTRHVQVHTKQEMLTKCSFFLSFSFPPAKYDDFHPCILRTSGTSWVRHAAVSCYLQSATFAAGRWGTGWKGTHWTSVHALSVWRMAPVSPIKLHSVLVSHISCATDSRWCHCRCVCWDMKRLQLLLCHIKCDMKFQHNMVS